MIDLFFSALNTVDSWLPFSQLSIHCLLWGAIAGTGSSLIYAWLSNQVLITVLKSEAGSIRRQLLDPATDPAITAALVRKNLSVSFKLLGKVLIPALASSVPVLLLATWMESLHAHDPQLSSQMPWGQNWELWFFAGAAVTALALKIGLKLE